MPQTAVSLKQQIWVGFKDYFLITFGTVLMTLGVYFFKIPNGFVTGGVSGMGTILGKVTPFISSGQWIMIINVLLMIAGFIVLGKMNSIKTVYCSLLFSFSTYICELVIPLSGPLTDQPLLELVYAMLLTSVGSAVLFNNDASTGGTDIVALILKKYTSLDIGKALLVTDFVVASCSFFIFGIEAGLFSLLGLFAKAFLVDSIIESINSCKYFIVITEKRQEISEYIMNELHHGATITEGVGSYTGNDKYMIHTVCKRIEAVRLRHNIKRIDPHSFIVITTTSEIVGRGFRSV